MKKTLFAFVLVLLMLAAYILVPPTAEAACPAPGTGIAGALNMVHDAKMLETMIAHVPQQGWDGMAGAVANSSCP